MTKKYLSPECEQLFLAIACQALCSSTDPRGNIDELTEDDLGIDWEEF